MNNFRINDQLRITNLQQKTKNKLSLEHRKHYPIPVVKRYPSWQKYLAMQLLNLYIKSLLQCMTMMHETTGRLLHLPKSQKTQLLHNYNPAQKVRRTKVPLVGESIFYPFTCESKWLVIEHKHQKTTITTNEKLEVSREHAPRNHSTSASTNLQSLHHDWLSII